jgi:hypothetical protein
MDEQKSWPVFPVALIVGLGGFLLFVGVRRFYALSAREQHHRMITNLEHEFQTNGGIMASNGIWSFPQSQPK